MNKLNKIKCYYFNKQDLIILLSVYNAAYLLFSTIVKDHLIACFVVAILLSLATLFVITWFDLVKKVSEEELESKNEQKLVRENLRDEYLKVHKMKKKNELLKKAGCPPDVSALSLNKHFGEIKEVHFDYLQEIISSEKIRGEPEGT